MSTPADDCGVTGGCTACPLFVANVCGDPAPAPERVTTDFAPERPLCGPCDAGLPMSCTCPPIDWAPLVDAYLKAALAEIDDPDAPDVDPAEPKPEGAGCCGGACRG